MKELGDLFHYGESPYISCYVAGKIGYSLEEVMNYCLSIGIQLRKKDVRNWENGSQQQASQFANYNCGPVIQKFNGKLFHETKLEDFPQYPEDWKPSRRRYFPCGTDNRPMTRWGWSDDFTPTLYTMPQAKRLSPCGWCGQNMLYQRFIVLDIDGVGHGEADPLTIQFGEQYKDNTLSFEDPQKPGSFHLYFLTDRIIPVKHFPWAHIDLMGNAVNAAVYLKSKKGNGVPAKQLTNDIWTDLVQYQAWRKLC